MDLEWLVLKIYYFYISLTIERLMNNVMRMFVIAIAVASTTLTPFLMIQTANAASR